MGDCRARHRGKTRLEIREAARRPRLAQAIARCGLERTRISETKSWRTRRSAFRCVAHRRGKTMTDASYLCWKHQPLLSTGLQPGVTGETEENRFNGFPTQIKPVETVFDIRPTTTPG